MNISSKYTVEKTDTSKEATILIRCFGPNAKTKAKLISDLGMTESEAQQIIDEHASAMANQSKSYFRDRALLVLCGLMLGLIGGLFLFVSAPRAAMAGTLPFTIMVWIGTFYYLKYRKRGK